MESKEEKVEGYTEIKGKVRAVEHAQTIFTDKMYQTDLAAVQQPKTPYVMQTYQYRIETFTPVLRNKYAKDLRLYSSKAGS